jgi:hypothetical protein
MENKQARRRGVNKSRAGYALQHKKYDFLPLLHLAPEVQNCPIGEKKEGE